MPAARCVQLGAQPPVTQPLLPLTPPPPQLALGNLVLYPCSMSFPIMKDYGLPPAPSGALNVKLLRAEGLQFYPTRLRCAPWMGSAVFVRVRVRLLAFLEHSEKRSLGIRV